MAWSLSLLDCNDAVILNQVSDKFLRAAVSSPQGASLPCYIDVLCAFSKAWCHRRKVAGSDSRLTMDADWFERLGCLRTGMGLSSAGSQ